MKKWEVTFKFTSCTPAVLVLAETSEEAVDKARDRDFPPVPDYIPATAVRLGKGGARPGAGAKKGVSRVKVRREVKKGVLWTPSEWLQVETRAKEQGLTVAEYQRMKVLSGKI